MIKEPTQRKGDGVRNPGYCLPFVAACIALTLAPGCTTAPGARATTTASPPPLPGEVLEPLRAMGDALRSAKTMRFTSRSLMDEALENGPLVQIGRRTAHAVRRPDRLHVEIQGDDANWALWYDGTRLTVLDRATEDYAVAEAPPVLDELLDAAINEYGLSIPMSDLLYADADRGLLKDVRAARYLGVDSVGDARCHHLAFRQETIDWQLWIEEGEMALPRKLVITYKLEPGLPQYVCTLEDWELGEAIDDATFTASVPRDGPSMSFEEFLGLTAKEQGHEEE